MGENGWYRLGGQNKPTSVEEYLKKTPGYWEQQIAKAMKTARPEKSSDITCNQVISDAPVIQSESNLNPNTNLRAVCSQPAVFAEEMPSLAPLGSLDMHRDTPASMFAQSAGQNGPCVGDAVLHETLAEMLTSCRPYRIMHAKGFGARGLFYNYKPLPQYTRLCFLQEEGQETPVTTRFSLAVSDGSTADSGRNIRGFATKFYTDHGVFDLLCAHLPVFPVRDPMRAGEAIRSFQPSPVSHLSDSRRFWDFAARAPESLHFITWLYSDAGTVKSFRRIRGYGVNTYVWENDDGQRRLVKYHWLPLADQETIDAKEAALLAARDPDCCGRDLFQTIAAGDPVQFELNVQLMEPEQARLLPYDPLDATKVWDEAQFPLLPVGRLVLNRNVENWLEETEKLAFSPANLLDGAQLSHDRLLAARSYLYWDAQRRRLGDDFRSIPINGQKGWKPSRLVSSGLGIPVEGKVCRQPLSRGDDFSQAGQRFRALSRTEQDHLLENMADDLRHASSETQEILTAFCAKADPDMGQRLKQALSDS